MMKFYTMAMLFCAFILYAQKPISKFSATASGSLFSFNNESSGVFNSYLWEFPGGTPATSNSQNANSSYGGVSPYIARLTTTNALGSSILEKTITPSGETIIDLSTGRNDDGSLMSTDAIPDTDWTVTNSSGEVSTPVTRITYTGWSYAISEINLQNSVWVTQGSGTGYFDYKSKVFSIPNGVSDAKLNLRSLSFVRNWTYLVKINDDNTITETQITATTWMNDGAKGWVNSRSPEVSNYHLLPGKYYIKVKLYTNNDSVRGSIDVNANVKYGAGFQLSNNITFSTSSTSFCNNASIPFNAEVEEASAEIYSYSWVFKKGLDSILVTGKSPHVSFPKTGDYSAKLKVMFSNEGFSSLTIPNFLTVVACQDYTLAPNSFIFDTNKAITENYDGLLIPVKKAYKMWGGNEYFKDSNNNFSPIPSGAQSADVFWEDVPGLVKSVLLINGTTAEDTKIKVVIDRTKGKGNAVIAFKVNNNIYWSWHIWATDNPENGVTYAQGFETDIDNNSFEPQYMDRNLGAVNKSFVGNSWNKSGGLQYQWGRKDPIPPLEYKDGTFYEVIGSAGTLRHSGAINTTGSSQIKMITRGTGTGDFTGSNFINDNIKYSVKNPIDYIVHTENTATWFSNQQYKIPNNDVVFIESWDLWSDNRKGKYINVNSSDPIVSTDSKSYEVKSSFDPCPNGWRIPSNYTSAGVNNNLNPFGRKNSGVNDDNTANSIFYPNSTSSNLDGIKVYPGLGIDFTSSSAGRNIGIMPLPGNYEYYPASNRAIYQDQGADGILMTSTYGTLNNGGAAGVRGILITSDPGQPDTPVGRNTIHINETFQTSGSGAVRCVKDPNYSILNYDFITEYVSSSQNLDIENYKNWSKDPNSFVVMTNTANASDRIIDINLRKAYAMQRLYLNENNEMPSGSTKTASIQWANNNSLINAYEIIEGGESGSILRVTLNPNQTGNAVIAFHLGNNGVWGVQNPDKIMWSWHIWAPQNNISEKTYVTESAANGGVISISNPNFVNPTKSGAPPLVTTFMDRNLGAVTVFPNTDGMGGTAIANSSDIRNSGGLHYQWGRKDPIPTFYTPGGVDTTPIYRQTGYSNNSISYSNAVYDNSYITNSTAEYNNYSSLAGVFTNDSKSERSRKIIKYSVEHPFSFMYHNRSGGEIYFLGAGTFQSKSLQIKDWISPAGEIGNAADRWGHSTEKSPYDPCPAGWRVPDTSFTSMINGYDKGTSPWFYNNYKKNGGITSYGFSQAFPFNLKGSKANNNSETEKLYPGKLAKKYTAPATVVGWEFDFEGSLYNIGNFPNTGIRGILGGNDWVDRYDTSTLNYKKITGVWTASLGDFYTGYAIAMQIDEYSTNGELLTGVGHYPQAGMGVRCAKDISRYLGIENMSPHQKVALNTSVDAGNAEILLFPNPTSNEIFVNKKVTSFKLYDLSGKLLKQDEYKKSIDMSLLPNGEYIIILDTDEGKVVSKKIIKK